MDCVGCGASNRDGARFCRECGTTLARRCLSCGAALDPEVRFCDECGTPTAQAAASGGSGSLGGANAVSGRSAGAVRKTVTALFADLGGSTSFGERTDPEIARVVMAQYHALLQSTIDAHGGTVAKFMGDGMMALFGVPDVAEDDATRAVHAGIDAQRRFEEFATEIARRHGETLTMRVGINTGELVMADGDADLVGDVLNVAARLEKACAPGRVLVGEETWRLTRAEFGFAALGSVSVAGRVQPVAIYEIDDTNSASVEVVAAFVGRSNELDRLRAALARAKDEKVAQLVTVLGSPGVGKTRLSREFTAEAERVEGARSVEIRCDRAGEATFAPIAQLIRQITELEDDATPDVVRERIAATVPGAEQARLTEVLAGVYGAAAARSVEETFWAIRRLVESLATAQPFVIVIDDIQWAEPKLLDLLEHLGEWVSGAALTIVCLARPELREVRAGLAEAGRRVADVILLDGLDRHATEQLAASLLGADRLPAGLVERLPASTNGNPLFVRELVRMLVDDAVIERRGDGEWFLTIDAEAVEVPPTIQSLLASRVERLAGDERRVLELASVIGAEFSLGALRTLAGPTLVIAPLLESLRRKELVEPTGTYWGDEPIHRFHHVLIRDAAYRRLLKTARAELHQRVGEWMDAASAGMIGDHSAALAYHFEQACRYRVELATFDATTDELGARAAALLGTAAQRALDRDDLTAAGSLASRALRVLPQHANESRAELLLLACECLLASGAVAEGAVLVEELRAVMGSDEALQSWTACFDAQLVGLSSLDGLLEAEVSASSAAAMFERLDNGAGEAKAQQVRAGLLARLGRVGDAEAVLDLALGAARAADDRRRVTAVLGAAPQAALFGPSPVARAGGRCLDVVRLLRITTASPSVEATSLRCQAVLEALRGRFDVARNMLATARATVEELGLRHGLLETDLFTGMVEFVSGDFEAAIAPLRSAYEGLGTLGVGADAGQAAALLARAVLTRATAEAIAEADRFATASEQLAGQNLKTSIAWRVARAEVLAARGEIGDAIVAARAAVEIAERTDLVLDHAEACATLGSLYSLAGDNDAARRAANEARRLYELKGATVPAERLAREDDAVAVPSVRVAESAAEFRSERKAERAVARMPRADAHAASSVPLRSRRAVNTAVRVSGRLVVPWSEVAEVFSDDVVWNDRRRLVGGDSVVGRSSVVAHGSSSAAIGLSDVEGIPIAIRGDRLALFRSKSRSADAGFEITFLFMVEIDEQKRVTAISAFDDDAVNDALAELDTRFIEGEGASHAKVLQVVFAGCAASRTNDVEALMQFMSPNLVTVDHTRLGFGTGNRESFAEWRQSDDVVFATLSEIGRTGFVTGNAVLGVHDMRRADQHGNVYEWTSCLVSHIDDNNQVDRMEWFDEDDWDAALARLDELGEGPATRDAVRSVGENAAARLNTAMGTLIFQGRIEGAIATFSADFVVDDRRTPVSWGVMSREEFVEGIRASFEIGLRIDKRIVATRGDRLVLEESNWNNAAGDEIMHLTISEIDALGFGVACVTFDLDAIGAAVEELDARWIAGEGSEHRDLLATFARVAHAAVSGDAEFLERATTDFVAVDHSRLGWPTTDREGFAAMQRSYNDAIDRTIVVAAIECRSHAVLTTVEITGVDVNASKSEWLFHQLWQFDAAGDAVRFESFPEDKYAEALARLDELSGDRPDRSEPVRDAPPIENSGSRAADEMARRLWSGDPDSYAAMLDAEVVVDDRRSVTSSGLRMNRDDFVAVTRSFVAVGFTGQTNTTLACRGDWLGVARSVVRNDAGDEVAFLAVGECNPRGRLVRITFFDDDDLDVATELLDEWYLESLDPASAFTALRLHDYRNAWDAGNVGASHALMGADLINVDHRQIGYGTFSSDEGHVLVQVWTDTAAEKRLVYLSMEVRGSTALLRSRLVTTASHGGAYEHELFSIVRLSGGLWTHLDLFDERDHERARVRFEELAREQRSPHPDNMAVRWGVRGGWLRDFPGVATLHSDVIATVAPDIIEHDHRRGVNAGTIRGRDAWIANQRAVFETLGVQATVAPLAVRGERLVLSKVNHTTNAGFVVEAHIVMERDALGRLIAVELFDDDDLIAAVEYLDARYAEIRDEPEMSIGQSSATIGREFNRRDWAAMRALLAPDFVSLDYSPIGFGTEGGDGAAFVAVMQTYIDVAPDAITWMAKAYERGSVELYVIDIQGTTTDGNEYSWRFYTVITTNADGLHTRFETFGEIQWSEALARFDELCIAENGGARHTVAQRAVDQMLDTLVWRASALLTKAVNEPDWDAAGRVLAAGFVRTDHRSGVSAATTRTRDEWVAAAVATRSVGLTISSAHAMAVRGDRLALVRQLWTSDGNEVPMLVLAESASDGLLLSYEYFDEADFDRAFDELEQRYIAGEGAQHSYMLLRRLDDSAVEVGSPAHRALHSPTFRIVNHRRVGWPMASLDDFVARDQFDSGDVVAQRRRVTRWLQVRGNVLIAVFEDELVTHEGSEYTSPMVYVLRRPAGLADRMEVYDPEDFDAAYERFEELAIEPLAPGVLDNRAVRHVQRLKWLGQYGVLDEYVDLIALDLIERDHRRGVRGTLVGRDAWLESQTEISQLLGPLTSWTAQAVRGERLVLWQFSFGTSDSFEVQGFIVNELDVDGRVCRIDVFDDDDLDAALQRLEDLYCEGEGNEHEYVVRRAGDVQRAHARRDWDAYRALLSPSLVATSHRTIGFPLADRDDLVQTVTSLVEAVPDARLWVRTMECAGGAVLSLIEVVGSSTEGTPVEWSALTVIRSSAGLIVDYDIFDVTDVPRARARFEELATLGPDSTVADNAVVRLITRAQWLGEFERGPERARYLRAMWDDNIEYHDLRRGVSGDPIVGRDAINRSIVETRKVFGRIVEVPVAVRGDRLALFRLSWINDDGFESSMWSLHEANEAGAIVRTTIFDESERERAEAELEALWPTMK